MHGANPKVSLYVPATHLLHWLPSPDKVLPALHTTVQLDFAVLPDNKVLLPAGQAVHGADPATALYVPASQTLHGPPSGPVLPRLHAQMMLPGIEDEYAPHSWHSADPADVEKLPAEQAMHVLSDVAPS